MKRGESKSTFWENAHTVAAGLRVPKPLGDALSLAAIRASGGTAIAVSDEELLDASIELATATGIFPAPEGGACVAALKKLLANGFLKPDERIVLYNTGTGLKYLEAFSTRFPRTSRSEQDKLGRLDHAPIVARISGLLLLTLALDFWDTIRVFWESALPPGFGPAGVSSPRSRTCLFRCLSTNDVKESCQ